VAFRPSLRRHFWAPAARVERILLNQRNSPRANHDQPVVMQQVGMVAPPGQLGVTA